MRHLFLAFLLSCVALPAQAESLAATYDHWKTLRDRDTLAISFADGMDFLTEHPGWPEEKIIRLRTEAAALQEQPPRATMDKFCTQPPISGRGMFACLRSGTGDTKMRETWLRQGWVQGDFAPKEEQTILEWFGTRLTQDDHIKRTDRLLFEEKTTAAERMFRLVPANRHTLYRTRIALINDDKKAPTMLGSVPAEQRHDAGLLFDRIQWRARHGDADDTAELFLAAPTPVPYPDLWWSARASLARTLLSKRDYKTALAVLAAHGEMKTELLADALWMKGWIMLEYQHDAAAAYKDFYRLYNEVETPVSKARAAYWAGRAAKKNGNPDIAREWMDKAAQHPTVFYGQLAQLSLKPNASLALPTAASFSAEQKATFLQEPLVQVAKARAADGDTKMRDLFITHMANQSTEAYRFALLADMAHDLGDVADGVRVAKAALRKGVVLVDAGWPTRRLPNELAIEPALALAITRQESEFDATARSSANARGMMQLLPGTAKQTARKLEMPYRDSMLDNPNENITLGSKYLGDLVRGFDGSYVLAIASYNAGPANTRKWLARNGALPQSVAGTLNWIESIPFAETRNYVMRVLENVQVYRALAEPDAPMKLEQDMMR